MSILSTLDNLLDYPIEYVFLGVSILSFVLLANRRGRIQGKNEATPQGLSVMKPIETEKKKGSVQQGLRVRDYGKKEKSEEQKEEVEEQSGTATPEEEKEERAQSPEQEPAFYGGFSEDMQEEEPAADDETKEEEEEEEEEQGLFSTSTETDTLSSFDIGVMEYMGEEQYLGFADFEGEGESSGESDAGSQGEPIEELKPKGRYSQMKSSCKRDIEEQLRAKKREDEQRFRERNKAFI